MEPVGKKIGSAALVSDIERGGIGPAAPEAKTSMHYIHEYENEKDIIENKTKIYEDNDNTQDQKNKDPREHIKKEYDEDPKKNNLKKEDHYIMGPGLHNVVIITSNENKQNNDKDRSDIQEDNYEGVPYKQDQEETTRIRLYSNEGVSHIYRTMMKTKTRLH